MEAMRWGDAFVGEHGRTGGHCEVPYPEQSRNPPGPYCSTCCRTLETPGGKLPNPLSTRRGGIRYLALGVIRAPQQASGGIEPQWL